MKRVIRKISKKKKPIAVFATATAVLVLAIAGSSMFFKGKNSDVAAVVNGVEISKAEIEQRIKTLFEEQNFGNNSELGAPTVESMPKEAIEILAKEIYIEQELTKKAKDSKVANSDEVKRKIAESTNRIIRQAYIDSQIKEKVSEEKISEKYAELSNEVVGKKELLISHIVVKTKEQAEKIAKELSAKKPAKFSDLAKKYSIDNESAKNGGELGFILEDNIVKEIASQITSLKIGEISSPIETKFGWHIVKVSDSRDAKALPFEEVKENIRQQLYSETIEAINSEISKDIKVKVLMSAKEPEKKEENSQNPENTEATTTTEEISNSKILSEEEVKAAEAKEENTISEEKVQEEKAAEKPASEEKASEKSQEKSSEKSKDKNKDKSESKKSEKNKDKKSESKKNDKKSQNSKDKK